METSKKRLGKHFTQDQSTSVKRGKTAPQCAICLYPCDDLTLLENCQHWFCLNCIQKWLMQKPVCPLCKTNIRTVKHELQLDPNCEPNWEMAGVVVAARDLIEAEEFSRLNEQEWPFTTEYVVIDETIKKLRNLRETPSGLNIYSNLSKIIEKVQDMRVNMHKQSRNALFNKSLFRFVVYYMDANRTALVPTSNDVVLTDDYVRNNQTYLRSEWIPFVMREITAITGLQAINIQKMMDLIFNAFQNPHKHRSALLNHLKSLGVTHPRTFWHHLSSFGSANQSLNLYDANSRYELRRPLGEAFRDDDNDIHVIFSAPSTRDLDVEIVGSTSGRHTSPLNLTNDIQRRRPGRPLSSSLVTTASLMNDFYTSIYNATNSRINSTAQEDDNDIQIIPTPRSQSNRISSFDNVQYLSLSDED